MQDLIALLDNAEVLGKFTNSQKQQIGFLAVRRVLKRDEIALLAG